MSFPAKSAPRPAPVAGWLSAVAALIVLMVVVGGITRLTESGLSIVEWKPVSGTLPPLSEQAWHDEFAAYQTSPEYQQINRGMSLSEYKNIYFWEWLHRLIGRLIGVAFALPLIWFWAKGAIPRGYKPRLVALLGLGALQGVIGWWMVTSGLAQEPAVSHVRLAVHLNLALLIIALLVWTAADMLRGPARISGFGWAAAAVLFVQLVYGAFVAGLDAGYAYAEWPAMGGGLLPAYVGWLEPVWRNFVDNPTIVQFFHRWWAFVAFAMLIALGVKAMKLGSRRTPIALHLLVTLQVVLGIATLISGVEIWIAAAHQGVAALIVWCTAACIHRIGEPAAKSENAEAIRQSQGQPA
ncbi:heme A synthase [Pacificimonas flava]|uniref:Heme A synthase n=2 Tax=Pacificimonas TaxID=1960290 RepID=A0A219B6S5_9SPHN|nr:MULTISPECIES: COX15/CtaA family protein [Pacificimonas]MBZ6378664.1 COX15/CtaA family protein [Pacificimonas aurantium]OWV34065.1 heme A synthase [Pacificimonas flava]